MDTAFTIQEAGREDCRDWPLGKCTKGDECTRYHHPNLDPEQLGEGTYMVPDDTTKACDRCLSRIYPCDKPSRGPGADDPCSECRWFGGPTCRCVIPKSGGYNDKLWRLMMARGKSLNYTLPKYKHRDEATNNKDLPSEMPSANIIVGWVGESKEDLLKKGDMLPAGVRDSPVCTSVIPFHNVSRALNHDLQVVTAANDYLKAMLTSKLQQRGYLVPPALSGVEQRAQDRKRKRNEAETTIPASPAPSAPPLPQKPSFALPLGSGRPSSQPAPAIPQMPPPPAIPQLDPNHGRVVNMSYSCLDSVWTVTYRSGITITGPAGPPPPEVRF